jgi:hypothetical protein
MATFRTDSNREDKRSSETHAGTEREGFEPSVRSYDSYNRLAICRFRPLSHLSRRRNTIITDLALPTPALQEYFDSQPIKKADKNQKGHTPQRFVPLQLWKSNGDLMFSKQPASQTIASQQSRKKLPQYEFQTNRIAPGDCGKETS